MRRAIYVLYEYSSDLRPHGSASVRLLLPLTHPENRDHLDVYSGPDFNGQPVDAVIVDRMWRPDVSQVMVENLMTKICQVGAKLIYSLDDNFFDIPKYHVAYPIPKIQIIENLLCKADGVIVTTELLKKRYQEFNPRIIVIPHALDERLLVVRHPTDFHHPYRRSKKIVGYMGTPTHDNDLLMVLPALKAICENHPEVEIQVLGAVGKGKTRRLFEDLPVHFFHAGPGEEEYPLFMAWFTGQIDWDIAIAPLKNNSFNRSKSDIKYLDYCAIGAAGIYSALPPYQQSVRHLETGWLAENRVEAWVEALETLLMDDELRYKLARNAYLYLHSQRTLAHCASRWRETIEYFLRE